MEENASKTFGILQKTMDTVEVERVYRDTIAECEERIALAATKLEEIKKKEKYWKARIKG